MDPLSLLLHLSIWQECELTPSPHIGYQIQLVDRQSRPVSKVEYQSEVPKDTGASGLIFRCSLRLQFASPTALGKGFNCSESLRKHNEIKKFTWQRDCEDLIR